MSVRDPIELCTSAATSTLGRAAMFLGTGGAATWLGLLCSSIEPGHFASPLRLEDMGSLLTAIIMLPFANGWSTTIQRRTGAACV